MVTVMSLYISYGLFEQVVLLTSRFYEHCQHFFATILVIERVYTIFKVCEIFIRESKNLLRFDFKEC